MADGVATETILFLSALLLSFGEMGGSTAWENFI